MPLVLSNFILYKLSTNQYLLFPKDTAIPNAKLSLSFSTGIFCGFTLGKIKSEARKKFTSRCGMLIPSPNLLKLELNKSTVVETLAHDAGTKLTASTSSLIS